ncbi:MAG: VanZ family protein [Phycisphaerales bacterium]|jgi:VanZ family protein|nr:VanZ family protein [Phycisphaerales bacterium]MBT7170576.1 VanZ family protein [Phycisphaerales bacterium]
MTLRRLSTVGLVALWIASYVVTHLPAEKIPDLHASDKTLHVIGYFVLAAAWLIRGRIHSHPWRRRATWAVLIFPLYALFDETTQPLVNRFFGWGDILADLIGLSLAVALDGVLAALFRPSAMRPSDS